MPESVGICVQCTTRTATTWCRNEHMCGPCVRDVARRCATCGLYTRVTKLTVVDSTYFCEGCLDGLAVCANGVGGTHRLRIEYPVITGYTDGGEVITAVWCGNCAYRDAATCIHCQHWWMNSLRHLRDVDGYQMCARCRDTIEYHTCEDCGASHTSYMMTRQDGDWYCNGCLPCDSDEDSVIRGYSHRPSPKFTGNLACIPYGVELEVDAKSRGSDAAKVQRVMGNRVYLKEDGSISNGFEIVTHPHTLVEMKKLWQRLWDSDVLARLDGSRNGLHVHVGKTNGSTDPVTRKPRVFISRLAQEKIVVFINDPAHKKLVEFMAGRDVGHWGKLKKKVLGKSQSTERYEAVNTLNRNTIEFRIFRGTTDKAEFEARLEFVDAVVRFCRSHGLNELSQDEFLEWVRQGEWPELKKLLVKGKFLARPERGVKKVKGAKKNVAPSNAYPRLNRLVKVTSYANTDVNLNTSTFQCFLRGRQVEVACNLRGNGYEVTRYVR